MSSVAARLELVRQRIRTAAEGAGRDPSTVRLVAVSKTQPASAVAEAYAAGQRDFGENYVQELVSKAEALQHLPDLRWHFIGHLQRNKVRHVVRLVHAVHGVDTAELAAELAKRARSSADSGSPLAILVEVNIGREPQKHGVLPEAVEEVLASVERESELQLRGLMCVPPLSPDPTASRPYFDALVALREAHGGATRLPELSMGMTADLESAVAAGSTLVRVGTAIFGERPPKGGR
jgi:pyridoxal phosphate enzyme (YggS family)